MDDAPAPPSLWRGDGTEQAGLLPATGAGPLLAGRHVRIRGLSAGGVAAAEGAARAGAASVSLVPAPGEPASLARSASRLLSSIAPGTPVRLDGSRLVDAEVAVAYGALAPDVSHALTLGGPHAAVLADERGATVLPVLPGATACLRCRDLALTDDDAAWPVLARQCESWPPPPDPLTSSTAAALAVAAIATLLAGEPAPAWRVESGLPRIVPAPPHPACGCGARAEVIYL
ncbi:hypothetical protein [Demequina iriomotensis]|uniref:hypothetical protein n=1 Tax=Demequina iriomotensis TaxID=1536641 RepID=UPI000783CB7B|nr:hypothetical protein [Demequina iriomotensis]